MSSLQFFLAAVLLAFLITEIWFLKSKLSFDPANPKFKAMEEAFLAEDAALVRNNFSGDDVDVYFHFDDHFTSLEAVDDFPMTDRLYEDSNEPLFEDELKVLEKFFKDLGHSL